MKSSIISWFASRYLLKKEASSFISLLAKSTLLVILFNLTIIRSIFPSMTLVDLNAAYYNQMISTPTVGSAAGSDATVHGYGTSKNFVSMLSMAQQLRLRPVGNSDNTEDWTFWKAVPVVDSLSFASDSAGSMSVTFRCFPDSSKDSAVSLGCFGDNDGI